MSGITIEKTRKLQKIFSRSSSVLFLILVGFTVLAFKGVISGNSVMNLWVIGVIVMAILKYLDYAVWKCPSCNNQMGTKNSISHCPSCGHQLYSVPDDQTLDDRIRVFVSKSERATNKEKLLQNLRSKINSRKPVLRGFYGFCSLLVTLFIVTDILPGKYYLGIWLFSLVVYLVWDFNQSRCPLCKGRMEMEHRFCVKCGLGGLR